MRSAKQSANEREPKHPVSIPHREWTARNPGIVAQIAREFDVSHGFVYDVMYKRRRSNFNRIEKRLAELGAPGFENEQPSNVAE